LKIKQGFVSEYVSDVFSFLTFNY